MYQVPSAQKRSWNCSPGLNGALAWVLGLGDQPGAGLRTPSTLSGVCGPDK